MDALGYNSAFTLAEGQVTLEAWDFQAEYSQASFQTLRAAGHWQAKYRLLLQWGKAVDAKPWLRRDEFRVRGCETSLWLQAEQRDGHWFFALDGESRIVKGLAVLVLSELNGTQCSAACLSRLLPALTDAGVSQHLSPSRNNGLRALLVRLQALCAE